MMGDLCLIPVFLFVISLMINDLDDWYRFIFKRR